MTDDLLLVSAAALKGATSPDSAYSRMGDDVPLDEICWAIAAAQEAVAGRLGFDPLAALYTEHVAADVFPHTHYPQARPVGTVETEGATTDGRRITLAEAAGTVVYTAGWRGAHHVLPSESAGEGEVDVRTLPGLSGLTALPPLVPADVRSVIVDLALVGLDRRRQNLLGGRKNTVEIGDDTYRTEGYRASAESEILGGLSVHHRIARV